VCEEEKMLNSESFNLTISHLVLKGRLNEKPQKAERRNQKLPSD
jgi:hypothetical protein